MLTKLLTTEAGIMATIAFVLIIAGLVMLFIQIVQKKREQKHNRMIFNLFVSGLMFILLFQVTQGYKNVIHQYYYAKLLTIRGERRPQNPKVIDMYVMLSDSMKKKVFLEMLRFIDHSKPSVIALHFDLHEYAIESHTEISKVVQNAKLIYLSPESHLRSRPFNKTLYELQWSFNSISVSDPHPMISDHYRYDKEVSSMYYMMYHPQNVVVMDNDQPYDPFIIRIIRRAVPQSESLLNTIPLNSQHQALINKYNAESGWWWTTELPSIELHPPGLGFGGDLLLRGITTNQDDQNLIQSYSSGKGKIRYHYKISTFEPAWDKQLIYRTEIRIRQLGSAPEITVIDTLRSIVGIEGKIIVVHDGMPTSNTSTIIQNILDEDFLWEPDHRIYPLVCLLLFLLFHFIYSRFEPWKGLGIIAGMVVLCLGIAAILFFTSKLLFNPYPIVASFLGMLVFMLPYELATERIRLITERLRLSAQLKAAHDLQMGLMPSADPVIPGYDISGLCQPANEVGGDYYDYVWLDDEKRTFGIAIADVSGKAMDAAMTAVMTSGMVYQEIGNSTSPKDILRKMNRPMYLKTDRRVFTAMSFAVIDTNGKTLTFSNAGQMQPMLRRGEELQMLKTSGPHLPLGATERVEYGEELFALSSGDLIVFYTDGIIEAMNTRSELFGFERLQSTVKESPKTDSAKKIVEQIFADVKKFTGSAPQHDDMTVVVVKVL